jgi:hypothetical protein
MIYYAASRAGYETPPQPPLGLPRAQIDADLGKPILVTLLPDGGQVATYRYRARDPEAKEGVEGSLGVHYAIAYVTQGYGVLLISPLVEPVLIGMAIHQAVHPPYGEVQFTFGPDGRLLDYGRPPPYGPADAVVDAPTLGAIRRRCWSYGGSAAAAGAAGSETGGYEERAYVECVASRFAVWSLD